ncbi:phosphotransferase family protein [Nocardioides ultimimeridianus]
MTATTATTAPTTEAESAWLDWAARSAVPTATEGLVPCYEVMDADPAAIPGLTVALGQLQAWVHARPATDAPGPTVTWSAALDRIEDSLADPEPEVDTGLVRAMLARLRAIDPGPLEPVPCHGDFTPVTVRFDPADHRAVAVGGWAGAVLSDREYDVAFTELGFWASAYLSDDPGRRTLMKVARSFLLNGYRAGYAAVAGHPDPHRLGCWAAFHACRLLATPLLSSEPYCTWDPATAAATVRSFRDDLAVRFADLVPSADPDRTERT